MFCGCPKGSFSLEQLLVTIDETLCDVCEHPLSQHEDLLVEDAVPELGGNYFNSPHIWLADG